MQDISFEVKNYTEIKIVWSDLVIQFGKNNKQLRQWARST